MRKKNRNTKVEDFEKYLADQMSAAERNAFEKELQKNAFEAEAMEGFEAIQTDISGDLKEIHNKIKTIKPKRKLHYWAAAATILLLISSGIIWLQLSEQNPIPKTAETKIKVEEKTKIESQVQAESIVEKDSKAMVKSGKTSKQTTINKKETKPAVATERRKAIDEAEIQDDSELENTVEPVLPIAAPQKTEQLAEVTSRTNNTESIQKHANQEPSAQNNPIVISGKIVSAEDKRPIPGVSLVLKGTTKGTITNLDGNFEIQLTNDSLTTLVASFIGKEQKEIQPQIDSNNYIELANDNIGLDEVVVVGFGTQKKKQTVGSISTVVKPANANASPSCGMEEYNRILNDNAVLPNSYSDNKRVVKLLLFIDQKGTITKIENINKAEQELVKLASKIINEAPPWNSKIVNGVNIASEAKLKIVFTKR